MVRVHVWSLALAASLLPCPPLASQTPGSRVQVSYTLPFSTRQQSMWGPADAPANLDFTIPLFDESWSESGTTNGVFSAAGFQWGGSISGSTSGAVGLSFRIFGIGTGAVDLNYPVRVVLDLPAPNSFRDGDAVTIDSRFELLPGWKLATTPPGGALKVLGRFGTHLGASGKICLFGCPDPTTLANFGVPTDPFELFSVTPQVGITLPAVLPPPFPRPLVIADLPYEFGALFDPFGDVLGIAGPVDAPRVATTATVGADGRSLTAAGQHRFVDVSVDLDHYLTFVGVPPLGFQSNPLLQLATGASFGYDVADMSLLLGITQRQTFTFLPRVTITVQLPAAVAFAVLNADGSTAQTGHGMTVSFDVGQSLRVTTPAGTRIPLPGTPTYGLANTFNSSSDFTFNERLVASAGRFSLHTPSRSVTTETVTYVCSFAGVLADVCEALGFVLQAIVNTVTEVVPPADVDLGPLFNQTLVNETQVTPLFPTGGRSGQWQLAGLQTFTEAPFLLDPEDPRIAVTTELVSAVLAAGGPAGAIVQTVRVRNDGDVPLSAAELRDAVAALFSGGGGPFQVLAVSSPTLVLNAAFDGGASPALLASGNVLAVGSEAVVTVTLAVSPGSIYRADVRAAGTSPIGTAVAAEAGSALGVVAFKVTPDQVSAWSNGVLPTRIGSFAAGQVDPATVRLEGVAPEQWNRISSGDLILKFRLSDVLSALDGRILAGISAAGAAGGEGGDLAAVSLADVVAKVHGGSGGLGELRALVLALRAPSGPLLASGANGVLRVLVVTGLLVDGTRFIGEDDLTVMHGGQ